MKKRFSIFILFFALCGIIHQAHAQVSVGITISARVAPPPLPVYTQPLIPGDGYMWVPGYWAYDNVDGYYWVPGVWVRPPHYGLLWTPAYWGFGGGMYGFHEGYWGPHIGFYGGINYGFGYGGVGFGGGVWAGNAFRYNTAVTNVNTTIVHNTYVNKTVINNTTINNRTSFNGTGGVTATPTAEERSATNEQHFQPTQEQVNHQHTAGSNRSQFASFNHGKPATTAMNKVNGRGFNQQNRGSNQQKGIAQSGGGGNRSGQPNAGHTANIQRQPPNMNRNVNTNRGGGQPQHRQADGMNRQQNGGNRQHQH